MTLEEAMDALEKATKSNEKLEAKNAEILSEKKKAQEKASEIETRLAELEAEREAKSTANEDKAALEKRLTDAHTKAIQKLQSENAELKSASVKSAAKEAMAAAFREHNIDPIHHDLLTMALNGQADFSGAEALIGGKPIADYFTDFAATDMGKRYQAAPANSGGGATGPAKSTAPGDNLPAEWNATHYSKLKTTDPETAKAYAVKHNHGFLNS